MTPEPSNEAYRILKGFTTLGTLTGIYPPGHPLIADKVREIYEAVQPCLAGGEWVRIDVVRVRVVLNRGAQRGGVGRSRLRAGCRSAEETAAQKRLAPIVFHVNHCESIG